MLNFLRSYRDKVGHALAYLGLGVFLGFYLAAWIVVVALVSLSILWELCEKWFFKIVPDWWDSLWSIAGGMVGLGIIKWLG